MCPSSADARLDPVLTPYPSFPLVQMLSTERKAQVWNLCVLRWTPGRHARLLDPAPAQRLGNELTDRNSLCVCLHPCLQSKEKKVYEDVHKLYPKLIPIYIKNLQSCRVLNQYLMSCDGQMRVCVYILKSVWYVLILISNWFLLMLRVSLGTASIKKH